MESPFDEFVAVRGQVLLRFALMLCGDRHQAEDLVQSALAKAFVRWSRVSEMERVLRYYEDLSDGEIATVLGCSPSTVRSQAVRALATLRAAIPTMEREALP